MTISRRGLLALFGAGATATPALATKLAAVSYQHGVASGDPQQDRIVFWTRVTPSSPGFMGPYPGKLLIATSADFKGARTVTVTTGADRDWTVKADVDGLKPGTDYWYRFEFDGFASAVGRTRTLPEGPTRDLVMAVASCSLYPNGYFNAYGAIAALERVDVVLHLGDYIYEYGAGPEDYGMTSPVSQLRAPQPPHECLSLADYRTRHAQYKADPQLQAAHARAPWIVVWDDHETANDSWTGGAENHNPDKGEGDWATRKAAALKAYYEWMPIRDPAPGGLLEAGYRSFRFGDLASLMMVETRLSGRDLPLGYEDPTLLPVVDGKPDVAHFDKVWRDPTRRMMGARQEQWLAGELDRSVKAGETWQVIGNQVVMARVCAPDFEAVMGKPAWQDVPGEHRSTLRR
ncbi:MAG: alkaline phosphatase D family protein, partial [Pseudomonadota bacterium]